MFVVVVVVVVVVVAAAVNGKQVELQINKTSNNDIVNAFYVSGLVVPVLDILLMQNCAKGLRGFQERDWYSPKSVMMVLHPIS